MSGDNLASLEEDIQFERYNLKKIVDHANTMMGRGKLILARKTLRDMYQQLIAIGRHLDAARLVNMYGKWVSGEEAMDSTFIEGPFALLEREIGHSIFDRKRELELAAGELLFRTGDTADKIYLVIDGELAVSVRNVASPLLVNLLHRGDLVGEGAMSPGSLRSADVFASKHSTLIVLSREELQSAISVHEDLCSVLMDESALRRKVTSLSGCLAFSSLPLAERAIVAEQSWEKTVASGEVIKEYDEHLQAAMLVVSGEIESSFADGSSDHYFGSLHSGTLFGLTHLCSSLPIPRRLVARDDVKLVAIPYTVLEDVCEAYPDIRAHIDGAVAVRYNQTVEAIRMLSSSRIVV